ncbi:photosynthetic NDH subunit of subcomplex B 3, chloroplastic-like isoform X1 [Salvia splendens]|uniref:photosynthetic NDH subunit of subcomplex B 3, chloroplastic-like isoform X1 n=1 Tax=Salvia splendens TaxID=180675 RepID=UPI001C251E94|nr:photosynthetic NDH subunit of subcomplex B 3, chloroplastic-like isoform X1 [Salvia splendens]
MAAMSFCHVSLRPPELSSVTSNHRTSAAFPSTTRSFSVSAAALPETSTAPSEQPEIELEFLGVRITISLALMLRSLRTSPKSGDAVNRAKSISGEKLLRNIMLDNKIELYAIYGKLMNCGGGGSCGTCIVEIIDGKDLLNERTNTELRYLKKKPDSWRLACQTIVGNKENSGKVVVQRLPQQK